MGAETPASYRPVPGRPEPDFGLHRHDEAPAGHRPDKTRGKGGKDHGVVEFLISAYKQKHYLKIQGTDTWDHPDTAKPLKDVQQGTKYLKSIGVLPRYVMMNSTTFDYLVENEQIKNALITSSGKTVDFTDEATVKEIFTRKTGLTPITEGCARTPDAIPHS